MKEHRSVLFLLTPDFRSVPRCLRGKYFRQGDDLMSEEKIREFEQIKVKIRDIRSFL